MLGLSNEATGIKAHFVELVSQACDIIRVFTVSSIFVSIHMNNPSFELIFQLTHSLVKPQDLLLLRQHFEADTTLDIMDSVSTAVVGAHQPIS